MLVLAGSVLAAEAGPALPTGVVVEHVACQKDATQTYALYLPREYTPDRTWPALLVLDPRGRAVVALELFRAAAERHGWIVMSSYDTRSDGPAEPNTKAINALWPEVHLRFATDPGRVYAAGFSGGAHLAWALGQQPGRLAGVIASGGRFIPEILPAEPDYACFATAGDTDFNYRGTRQVDEALGLRGAAHRLEVFTGQHEWMPAELAGLAVEWMELQAMRRGVRGRDEALVTAAYRMDVEAARGLEAEGHTLAALRRWQAVERGFADLLDTGEAKEAAARLTALPGCAAEIKEEARWEAFETQQDKLLGQALGELRNPDRPITTRRLLAALDIPRLQQLSDLPGVGGTTARRVLNRLFVQTAYYLPPEFVAAQELAPAITVLEVASTIRPGDATVLYNLACARARGGQPGKALDALAAAIDRGFRDASLVGNDPDLASLRTRERYQALLARLTAKAPTPAP